MGYSIYCHFSAQGYDDIDDRPQDYPFLSEFFKSPRDRENKVFGYEFAWIKPRTRTGFDQALERQFFAECEQLMQAGCLVAVSDDEASDRPPLASVVPTPLVPFVNALVIDEDY